MTPGMAEREIDLGTAGASARREYERRRGKREAATRERHPHIGNLLLRLQSPPAGEVAWNTGAGGEEALGAHLAKRCPDVIVLHDRRIPRSRANIDHLAVAPSGVYVIDAKRYKGKIEVRKPFFGEPAPADRRPRQEEAGRRTGTPARNSARRADRDGAGDASSRLLLLPQPRQPGRRQRPACAADPQDRRLPAVLSPQALQTAEHARGVERGVPP